MAATNDDNPGDRAGLIRVLLVEDLDLLRSALTRLMAEEVDIEVAGDVPSDPDLVVGTAARLRPDVVVLDVDRSQLRALTIIQQLRDQVPDCRVVALIAASPAGMVRRVLATDVLGAVDSNAHASRLVQAVRAVARGEPQVDVHLALAALRVAPNPLTAREQQVLRLAAEGATGVSIARQLHLSAGTVRNYLSMAITKTSAKSRIEAIRIASESCWL